MDKFLLKFEYNGRPHILEVQPVMQAYKVVFKVMIEQHEIIYEMDEEGGLRAVSYGEGPTKDIDAGLLADVATRIEDHLINGGPEEPGKGNPPASDTNKPGEPGI
ncbi:hypothetical protein F0L74_02120 [Chitinophaga agrisoli]|uniref:Uncharacterized protein n=1 Tax=Chitinophaga agrisoli TaxID=2607653 RepID=A0A5B2W159_9BACT|nr:hypothetical protein [Chitinophaga agrisoli]KAA2244794.1 hypothetical protein F0L74_02120 [Chitinophaga agrisoli]